MSHFNQVFQANELLFSNPLNAVQSRTTFDRSHTHKTSLDSGLLVPIYFDEVLPGDTHIIGMNYLARMTTPIVPIADNAVLDFSFFFVPTRLLWDDWKYFMGESRQYWDKQIGANVPLIYYDEDDLSIVNNKSIFKSYGGYRPGDLAAYLGLPIGNKFLSGANTNATISGLPFKAYAQIWNDWFRDQNFQNPVHISTDNGISTNVIKAGYDRNYVTEGLVDNFEKVIYGFGLLSVSKLPDYFTTCLPSPQKGEPVTLPVGKIPSQNLEVVNKWPDLSTSSNNGSILDTNRAEYVNNNHKYQFLYGEAKNLGANNTLVHKVVGAFGPKSENGINVNSGQNDYYTTSGNRQWIGGFEVRPYSGTFNQNVAHSKLYHNLVAKLPEQAIGSVNLNDLRLAFAVQQFLETDARGGSRYIEVLKNHFGVLSPDARLQRAEYIGGFRDYLNVQQVLATTRNRNEGQFVGDLGAYSLTLGNMSESIVYSSTEHGYIMGFVTVRVMHTYGQGVEKLWTRKSRYDYYWPVFDNLGEMPVYKREIAVQKNMPGISGKPAQDEKWNEVFGYNEAWAEYRWAKNKVTGLFNPNVVGETNDKSFYLSAWSFTDNYETQPTLNEGWIKENKSNIEQTLALDSTTFGTNQFLFDFFFDVKSTRPMSMFSIPGLTRM